MALTGTTDAAKAVLFNKNSCLIKAVRSPALEQEYTALLAGLAWANEPSMILIEMGFSPMGDKKTPRQHQRVFENT